MENLITIQKWKKEGESFIEDGNIKYKIDYKQCEININHFKIYVNGFYTGIKMDVSHTSFPFRKQLAKAINKYRKLENGLTTMMSVTKFDKRDELTELNLIH